MCGIISHPASHFTLHICPIASQHEPYNLSFLFFEDEIFHIFQQNTPKNTSFTSPDPWMHYKNDTVVKIMTFLLALVSTMLVKSTVCINPIIYFGLNQQFRKEILKMLNMFDEISIVAV